MEPGYASPADNGCVQIAVLSRPRVRREQTFQGSHHVLKAFVKMLNDRPAHNGRPALLRGPRELHVPAVSLVRIERPSVVDKVDVAIRSLPQAPQNRLRMDASGWRQQRLVQRVMDSTIASVAGTRAVSRRPQIFAKLFDELELVICVQPRGPGGQICF